MKISPRSTDGMNVNPTKPSGSSEIASTKDAAATPNTNLGRSSALGSNRSAYHNRVCSNQRPNASIGRHGLHLLLRDQRPARVGVTVNDTHNEVSVAATTTKANSTMNLPTMPGKNAMGKKTTTSTSVMVIAANPISERPFTAAASGGSPLRWCRSIFSKTTIESSTRIPTTRVIASKETVSIVKPASFMTTSVIKSDVGIAIKTTMELRQEARKKSMTSDVSSTPSSSVCMTPSICCFVYFACTLTTPSVTPGNLACSLGSAASTLLEVETSLACVVF